MIERQVFIKGLEVNYKIFKQSQPRQAGIPFLILHGWGSGSDKWQKVGELLAEKNFKVIIPDLPGFGKSQEPKNAWNLDSYVDFVYDFSNSLPELKNEFFLVGHSFSGALASKFAIKYNQKVKKLFLVSAACIREKTLKKQVLEKISKLFKLLSFLPFYEFARKIFYKFVVGGYDYLNVKSSMKETFLNIISENVSNNLPFIRVPTIIIWGDKDALTPLRHAEIISKKIENSKLIVVKEAKHALQISSPEILSEKILENL